jgi:hypothetical protein
MPYAPNGSNRNKPTNQIKTQYIRLKLIILLNVVLRVNNKSIYIKIKRDNIIYIKISYICRNIRAGFNVNF